MERKKRQGSTAPSNKKPTNNPSKNGKKRKPIATNTSHKKSQSEKRVSSKVHRPVSERGFAQQADVARKKKRPTSKKINQQAAKSAKQARRKRRIILRRVQLGFELLLTAIVVMFCIWFTINIRAHFVNGESMSPTFETGDRLFTNRSSEVGRYDIITFFPEEAEETYLKRVVAVPGDSIYLMGNQLYLFAGEVDGEEVPGIIYSAQLPDSTQVVNVDDSVAEELESVKVIPENQYFVMGDNRGNSRDSRSLGLIDADQIEGVVNFRFYPFSEFGFVH